MTTPQILDRISPKDDSVTSSFAHSASRPRAFALMALAALIAGAGCGGGSAEGRKAVSGTVTMNGAPIDDAFIEFTPMTQGTASFSGANIYDGKYAINAKKGLLPGEYKVRISMSGSTPEPEIEEMPGDSSLIPVAPQLIPDKYNSKTTLTAKVEANGSNEFNFELER